MSGRGPGLVLAVLLLCCAGRQAVAETVEIQSLEVIQQAVEQFLRSNVEPGLDDVEIAVTPLELQTTLPACQQALQVSLTPGSRLYGRGTTAVRCPDAEGWQVFVQTQVRVYKQVLVAARALTRNALLNRDDVQQMRMDTSTLYGSYLTDMNDVLGRRLKRSVTMGNVFNPQLLEAPDLVRRGQRVTLLARQGSLEVRMAGTAMSDGKAGELIQVRNLSSNRIVEGTVAYNGVIEIGM